MVKKTVDGHLISGIVNYNFGEKFILGNFLAQFWTSGAKNRVRGLKSIQFQHFNIRIYKHTKFENIDSCTGCSRMHSLFTNRYLFLSTTRIPPVVWLAFTWMAALTPGDNSHGNIFQIYDVKRRVDNLGSAVQQLENQTNKQSELMKQQH